ncbi:MAG: aminotransferase class I/II-fold pyridoxal phosphate-dependent enzyme [Oligoflexales bacterium]|nr:aminotransferase class I/II-fold pyridoxal phosphate-dependent enzyme [Oligoflexales bacterium]
MSSLTKAIRNKRFNVLDGSPVELVLESMAGQKHTLKLMNCSLTGLGVSSETELPEGEGFNLDAVLPPAKLKVQDSEIYLGRLVLRTHFETDSRHYYGFNTIDGKIPMDQKLSRFFDNKNQNGSFYDFELAPQKFSIANFISDNNTDIDLFDRCKKFEIFNEEWMRQPKYQYKTFRSASKGKRINLTRKRKSDRSDYLILGSNDYLGLASHPEVLKAAKDAIDLYGFGSTGSAVSTGLSDIHAELTEYIAKLFKQESALLYNSGYTANIGIISGITGEQDLILADILSHASIQDGMQMAKATSRFFKHNSPEHLEKMLNEMRVNHCGSLVITEGVFSMDGNTPPLPDLVKVAKKYNSRVMVDEAHSFGVVGNNGMGIVDKYNLQSKVDIIMGTFSKVCGGIGGFVAGSKQLVDWLHVFSRANVFSVSIPPSTAAAALRALQLFKEDKSLVLNLQKNIQQFIQGLKHLGWQAPSHHESSIIPVVIGDEEKLGIMNQVMLDEGVFVVPVIYPAVSKTRCRFRFTMMSTLTETDVDYVLNVFEKAMIKANFSFAEQLESEKKLNDSRNR